MIISRTPYRVSFFGGGTDYPAWYAKEFGAVLSTTIDKYCYLMCRNMPPFFGVKYRIVWSHIENVSSLSEILHPAVREGLRYLGFDDSMGLEIHHHGDLPARSGIGSSSSFSVGLINALLALREQAIDRRELALKAIELEQKILKETVGSQDQVAATFGGLNKIRFGVDGSFVVEPLNLPEPRVRQLESSLMLIYLGTSRLSTDVAARVTANMRSNGKLLTRMREMVDEGAGILRNGGDLQGFGELLHEGWMLKRALADGVSSTHVDHVYDEARLNGAVGGKLMGAGGTGFMILFVPPERQAGIKRALGNYVWVPFAFECSGSTIIYRDQTPSPR